MNERNVEALRKILAAISEDGPTHLPLDEKSLARMLAARGVLAPSALSPVQMKALGEWIENETAGDSYDDEAYRACVSLLRSVATGDALVETDASR